MSKYANKRMHRRAGNGRFRKSTPADIGIGGTCPKCRHLLLNHYDGDERKYPLDPSKFRPRCFTCEPLTPAEQARRDAIAAQDRPISILAALLR